MPARKVRKWTLTETLFSTRLWVILSLLAYASAFTPHFIQQANGDTHRMIGLVCLAIWVFTIALIAYKMRQNQ